MTNPQILVLGGTGKTGRRIAAQLTDAGLTPRLGSRAATPAFDWHDPAGWPAVVAGVDVVYVAFQPDVAVPGADETVAEFARVAAAAGVRRLVLLSGRGEEGALSAERRLAAAAEAGGAEWTVLRCSWFLQNFSEAFMLDGVLAGEVALPATDGIREPFVDADDIADAAVAALTAPAGSPHHGQVYELTGPRLLTFGETVKEIAAAAGRDVRFVPVPLEPYAAQLREWGLPEEEVELITYLFGEVLDGRNESLADGVLRATGRAPRDVRSWAAATAATGVWRA